ncbi:MAG TPA: glycosyltransferase family 4 protein, partial [Geminicoccaceae bacterium]|nr:glycosyltransferase family 4 protein [Geminicoccaceae bacterium]
DGDFEGFGLVFLEAMACGLPVLCYDRGGQNDFLSSGTTGAVIPLNDRRRFGAAVAELLGDPDRRKATGARNLARVEAYFAEHCVRRYEAVFEVVLAAHRRSRRAGLAPAAIQADLLAAAAGVMADRSERQPL